MEELHIAYFIDECTSIPKLKKKLNALKDESKLDWKQEGSSKIIIDDWDLDEDDIKDLLTFFDKNDVYPDMDHEEYDSDWDSELDNLESED